MATNQQTPFVGQDPSATGLQARTVQDKIRALFPANSPLLALVSKGSAKNGELVQGAGLIGKKATETVRFEAFTHTPPDITKVCGAVSSLTVTFASVIDIHVKMVFESTANGTVGAVDSISGSDVTFISIGSTFVPVEGDTLMRIGNAYEENSSDPAYLQKPDDNIYNTTQIFRFPTAISATADATKQLAGGDFFTRMKKYAMIEGLRDIERAMIFGKKASSGNTTSMTALGTEVSTTEGIFNTAQNSYSAGGSFTLSKLFNEVPDAMDDSVSDSDRVIMLTSKKVRGNILEQMQSSIRERSSDLAKYGLKAHKFATAGADIDIMSHDAFNRGGHENQALCLVPDKLMYRYMKGRDIAPVKGIQSNSTDGTIDEIRGEVGILADCGGYSLLKITDMF